MDRIYVSMIKNHFANCHQMLFLTGPRQAGKTTAGMMAGKESGDFSYLNWDNLDHRKIIVAGVEATAMQAGLNRIHSCRPTLMLDEIHKYGKWKTFLKGFYDSYHGKVNIIVTGSSRLDAFKKGGDSLMGRYFLCRLHQLSLAEILRPKLPDHEISPPAGPHPGILDRLLESGGFPEPYLKDSLRFLNRWKSLRQQQLIREDIRDLNRIQELGQMELLAELLRHQSGQLTSYANLADKVGVSCGTIKRWITTFQSFYYCFTLSPWTGNVPRSLIKEPKTYLWDWSLVSDPGLRAENLVASHLLKAVHFWTDSGLGEYGLWFLRDKEKRECDFLVTRDRKPWFMVEVKLAAPAGISSSMRYFHDRIRPEHAFVVAFTSEYVQADCFSTSGPVIVPARTFLSQLV
ncbi:MAG: ATP-binding protein [Candidatus Wallbacteria bacterium]|nr:ATP-binding protein [Candidatus Wallbacteria bacterium]